MASIGEESGSPRRYAIRQDEEMRLTMLLGHSQDQSLGAGRSESIEVLGYRV